MSSDENKRRQIAFTMTPMFIKKIEWLEQRRYNFRPELFREMHRRLNEIIEKIVRVENGGKLPDECRDDVLTYEEACENYKKYE